MRCGGLGDPEVGDLRDSGPGDQDVGGLDVSVNNAFPMRMVEGESDRGTPFQRFLPRNAVFTSEMVAQRLAIDELHRDERSSGRFIGRGIIGDHDVLVNEPSGGASLLKKTLQELIPFGGGNRVRQDDRFERYRPVDDRIVGAIDHPHTSPPELTGDFVAT